MVCGRTFRQLVGWVYSPTIFFPKYTSLVPVIWERAGRSLHPYTRVDYSAKQHGQFPQECSHLPLFSRSWYFRRGGIWNPFIKLFPASFAAAAGWCNPRRIMVLPADLLTIEVNQANNPHAMENPRHRVPHPARREPLEGAVMRFRMLDDVAPVLETCAASHASLLAGRTGVTNENVLCESHNRAERLRRRVSRDRGLSTNDNRCPRPARARIGADGITPNGRASRAGDRLGPD